ncbi:MULTISPECIES: DUF3017 domain-containing protein [unclassified Streptomyces]|uniref:DUF3017 domain-containing protein n=1 Tax=unclassified Streptomyces TaxID=2593676 RepID=UPI002256AE19|nr:MULTISPECIES: DUF3017 domain-containing protein [unclassified Streptomyces]MCX4988960.1 DUF3017 domain-containing protein [Streptomyces sp. NBC_00568]MCX5005818.1 DUF3017 domain-containing protein [Streptomyces sp. NBC_00638]
MRDAVTGARGEAAARTEAEAGPGTGPDVEPSSGVGSDSGSDSEADERADAGKRARARAGKRAEAEEPAGTEEPVEETVRDAISAPDAEGKPRRTTRRFPLFTRDTARPEGGGRAASGDAPAPARQWPILTVLSAVALGLLLTALDVFRVGTILIGAALLAGAVMRWMLPSVGMLAVRSRFTDMLTYGVLGAAIVLLAMMAQPNPLLEIPFLDDTLHFTVR